MEKSHKLKDKEIKEYDPQKDFIIETPQIVEETIYIKNPDNKNKITTIIKKYHKGKFLGKGGFAKCYEIKCCDTNKFYAAKVFEKKALINTRSKKKLISEIKLHKKLSHANIVNFQHFFEDKENVYILLELCTNQTLNELLKRRKRLTDIETQFYCMQITKALMYLHGKNIIHRDLKLGNLFLTGDLNLKLGDFGLAAKIKFPGEKRNTVCGTPNYIAPEILEKKNGHSFEVDIWSLGVIFYTLLIGKPPFETSDVKLTYKKIKYNDYTFPENVKIEKSAKELIENILVLDPQKRPSLKDILKSEYFCLFENLPDFMPISILALPLRKEYIEAYKAKLFDKEKIGNFHNEENFEIFADKQKNQSDKKIIITENDSISYNYNDKNKKENFTKNEGNVINNNFYINVANVNNIELKIDENFINKLKEKCQIIIKNNNNDNDIFNKEKEKELSKKKIKLNFNADNSSEKINSKTIIKKILEDGSIENPKIKNKKFDYIIYNINNTYMGIYFNDDTNILKNFPLEKKFGFFIYNDNKTNKQIKFDEENYQNILNNLKEIDKEILLKFEIMNKFSKKYFDYFTEKIKKMKFYSEENSLKNMENFLIKKILKKDIAILFKLSNKIVQFFYSDKSMLAMTSKGEEVFFKNKKTEEIIFDSIKNLLSPNNENRNQDFLKKLKYSKNILINLVNYEKEENQKK